MTWMAERRIACYAADARGHGRSGGCRGFISKWEDFLRDADQIVRSREADPAIPRFILGHSHGGLVVAMGAIRGLFAEAGGIILCSPFFQSGVPVGKGRLLLARAVGFIAPWARFASNLDETWISADPEMLADSRADPLLQHTATPRWYLSTLKIQAEARQSAARMTKPLLCMVGEADRVALPAASEQFVRDSGSLDKRLIRYPDLRHELLRETSRQQVFGDIFEWIKARTPRLQ